MTSWIWIVGVTTVYNHEDSYTDNMSEVKFDCGHSAYYQLKVHPRMNDLIFCTMCNRSAKVVQIIGPWRWKCGECRAHGSQGLKRATAELRAQAHANATGHTAGYWREGVKDLELVRPSQDVLPGTDKIPF